VARNSSEEHLPLLLQSTAGIIFLGTPHLGSRAADWILPLTRLTKIARPTNRNLVKVLSPASEMLAGLQDEFWGMVEQEKARQHLIKIFCFWEELEMRGIGKVSSRINLCLITDFQKHGHRNCIV
jgi:protein SERAC1